MKEMKEKVKVPRGKWSVIIKETKRERNRRIKENKEIETRHATGI